MLSHEFLKNAIPGSAPSSSQGERAAECAGRGRTHWKEFAAIGENSPNGELGRASRTRTSSPGMGRRIIPEFLYWAIRHIRDLWGAPEVLATENGCTFSDKAQEGSEYVEGFARIEYLHAHLPTLHRAVSEGCLARGRFESQKRTPQLSAPGALQAYPKWRL